MKKEIEKIHKKLENIDKSITSIEKTLIKQHYQLADHIKRTELLEAEIMPIKKHINMVQGVGAFIALVSLIATIYMAFN